jgi:C4-dicarboxylate-specific signal transduction histidine kinase
MNRLALVVWIALGGVAFAEGAGAPAAAALRQTCVDAMNADPAFAKSIEETVDKQLEQRTLEAHQDAEHHIQKNERHVFIAYAAMWVIAALFVVFLWRRQVALQREIVGLRKDLEAAAKESA